MKKFILIIAMLLITNVCFAANTQTTYRTSADDEQNSEEAYVDTDPGANGHGCLPVSTVYHRGGKDPIEIWFYVTSITGATVTLQWKFKSDSDWGDADAVWTDWEDYTEVTTQVIHDSVIGRYWRAIVKDDAQGTSSKFGIAW